MDWISDHLSAVFLGLAIVLGVAELASMDLILLMLAAGALAGMVTSLAGAGFLVSALVAAAVATASLWFVRPELVKKLHTGPDLQLGHGKHVGSQGVVTERITSHDNGRIKLAGEIWTAAPYDESIVIEPGETVEVLEIKGATAYVHPVPRLES